MAFCSNCGTRMIEGAAFCPECGTKNSFAGTPAQAYSPPPPSAQPTPAYQPPAQPVAPQPYSAPAQFGAVKFEIVEKETLKFLKADFENSAVRYESGGMYYMQGNLEMEANLPTAGGFLKSMVTRESVVKPVIRGSGTVWFEPTFGNFTIMELKGEEWILDKGAYYASEMGIEISSFTNKSISGVFFGGGFF